MARIISIVNQKGGVGKTTTAVNLAAGLALSEKRVLLLDLDPQSNSTRCLGYMADSGRPSVYDALVDGFALRDTFLPTDVERLTLAPSEPDLVGFEVEALTRDGREYILRRLVLDAGEFDFIFIDCPPSLGVLTVNGLAAADSVLIPVQCEYLALEGVTLLMGTLERVRQAVNPALEVHGILLTMYDERTNLSRQVVEDIRSYFGEKAYATIIPRSVRLSEAPSFGKPIFLYDPKSKGAEAYFSLAREVLDREEHQSTQLATTRSSAETETPAVEPKAADAVVEVPPNDERPRLPESEAH